MTKLKFFWIPAADAVPFEQELNGFLSSHRALEVEKHFCIRGHGEPGWAICVHWVSAQESVAPNGEPRSEKVDYRETLDPATFRIFAALRTWRKEVASAEGVPIYRVATNEQLAEIARGRVQTKADLEKVDGFGKGRVERYGEDLLGVCRRETASLEAEKAGKP